MLNKNQYKTDFHKDTTADVLCSKKFEGKNSRKMKSLIVIGFT